MILYDFFDNESLLITKYIGKIDKIMIESFIRFMLQKPEFSNVEKIISDYRESQLLITDDDLNEILKVRSQVTKNNNTNTVFLVANPNDTTLLTLISILYKSMTKAEVCSTLEFCIKRLSLNVNTQELDFRLKNLKNKIID